MSGPRVKSRTVNHGAGIDSSAPSPADGRQFILRRPTPPMRTLLFAPPAPSAPAWACSVPIPPETQPSRTNRREPSGLPGPVTRPRRGARIPRLPSMARGEAPAPRLRESPRALAGQLGDTWSPSSRRATFDLVIRDCEWDGLHPAHRRRLPRRDARSRCSGCKREGQSHSRRPGDNMRGTMAMSP